MSLLPFDPSKMAQTPAPAPGGGGGGGETGGGAAVSVGQLARMIEGALRHMPERLRVHGEISNFNERTHWYFRLKDETPGVDAVIDCVMFSSAAKRAGPAPKDGDRVELRGRIEFFARQGRTQLYVDSIERLGQGDLERRLRELCEQLRARGWFDPQRKRPLPSFPRRIAVITSKTGAALQDVLVTMKRRCPAVGAMLVDVRVQGPGAAEEIAAALRAVSAGHEALGVDAVILTRGGGSIEDLWSFNEVVVAEAVLKCAVPVVAAIGHETDTTIAELVADERCATPTQTAMRLTPDRADLLQQCDHLAARLRAGLARRLEHSRERLRGLARHPFLADPGSLVRLERERGAASARRLRDALRHRLAAERTRAERLATRLARCRPEALYAARHSLHRELGRRLVRAVRMRIDPRPPVEAAERLGRAWQIQRERCGTRLDSLERELVAVGPSGVLARGFSLTTTAGGEIIRSAGQVRRGLGVRTRVADGAFDSTVERTIGPGEGIEALAPPAARRPRSARPGRERPRDQMDLF